MPTPARVFKRVTTSVRKIRTAAHSCTDFRPCPFAPATIERKPLVDVMRLPRVAAIEKRMPIGED